MSVCVCVCSRNFEGFIKMSSPSVVFFGYVTFLIETHLICILSVASYLRRLSLSIHIHRFIHPIHRSNHPSIKPSIDSSILSIHSFIYSTSSSIIKKIGRSFRREEVYCSEVCCAPTLSIRGLFLGAQLRASVLVTRVLSSNTKKTLKYIPSKTY